MITRLTGVTDAQLREEGVPEARAAQLIFSVLLAPNTLREALEQ